MSILARQLGKPSGPIGWLITSGLARRNADFNHWLVHQLALLLPAAKTIIEVGYGPGVALQALLDAYPRARVIGVDRSNRSYRSASRRNAAALAGGRLSLFTGDSDRVVGLSQGSAELIVAVHVLYFWSDPERELRRLRTALAPRGHIALGYQLRADVSPLTQRRFADQDFALYESDDDVTTLLDRAGFTGAEVHLPPDPAVGGRLVLAAGPG